MPAHKPGNVLVVQTAFLGDVVLTLPLIQSIKASFPDAETDVVVVPGTAEVLRNHPSVRKVVEYDKRGGDSGIGGFRKLSSRIRSAGYDTALIPHRSLRSAALARWGGIPRRIGFASSAGRFLLTDTVPFDSGAHEVDRNLRLLNGLGIRPEGSRRPELYPSDEDREVVDRLIASGGHTNDRLIALAPGTAWKTKRWPSDRFADLARKLLAENWKVVIVGGGADSDLLPPHLDPETQPRIINAAGKLTILQSAELIRRSRALVCNDSAPMHLAASVQTPVVAIFGATVPAFGFGPLGPRDIVLETMGLRCRPCSIHGTGKCPIRSFVCMLNITPEDVMRAVHQLTAVNG